MKFQLLLISVAAGIFVSTDVMKILFHRARYCHAY